jgi:hypothetical protein
MGAFIPTSYDNEICTMLNTRFSDTVITSSDPAFVAGYASDTFIGQLRRHRNKGERLFDGNHNLARVSHRLAYSVLNHDSPNTTKPRHRWFFLLPKGLNQLPAATETAICAVLDAVLADTTIDSAVFSTTPKGNITLGFELDPQNSHVPQTVNQGGKNVCLVTLDCKKDQQLPDPAKGQVTDPPTADANELPINNVHVP